VTTPRWEEPEEGVPPLRPAEGTGKEVENTKAVETAGANIGIGAAAAGVIAKLVPLQQEWLLRPLEPRLLHLLAESRLGLQLPNLRQKRSLPGRWRRRRQWDTIL
jgi:hypothetical protein